MSDSTLYDDDILLWSEQQAAAIRRLREPGRAVPNELDVENVAEEIEGVGRSELAAVESYIELVLVHLIKLTTEPEAASARHWRGEIAGFHSGLKRRFAPSMRQRIDMDGLWADARAQVTLAADEAQQAVLVRLSDSCPVALDALLATRIDVDALAARVRDALGPEERR
jgi:hypothetical protein